MDDEKITLAEPKIIPLGHEEGAEAVRLLSVLIRAARLRSVVTPTPRRASPCPEDLGELADGSPSALQDSGKAAPEEAAGGGR